MMVCGSASGKIHIKDPRSYRSENVASAHSYTISDLDVSGNYIATCGYTTTRSKMVVDPMIRLFDVRTMKSLSPISLLNEPRFLKFNPAHPTSLLALSSTGELQDVDILNRDNPQFCQISTTQYCACLDISVTGELLAIGDTIGNIHLWSSRLPSRINHVSRDSEMPETMYIPFKYPFDENTSLNSVGMPYYTTPLLSNWPRHLSNSTPTVPTPIPSHILSTMKTVDFIGYAPNPGHLKRNQNLVTAKMFKEDGPKFRSEQEREKRSNAAQAEVTRQESSFSFVSTQSTALAGEIPRKYKKVEIKYSKFGIEDFDFEYYNKTQYPGLETHITNSYANPIIQTLFHIEPFRRFCICHSKGKCAVESCMTCEFGFLFRMLEQAHGSNCQATNFLGLFERIPQIRGLGLVDSEDMDENIVHYGSMIQILNRFIWEQLNQESQSSAFQSMFGLPVSSTATCQVCGTGVQRDTVVYTLDMERKDTFMESLARTLMQSKSTKSWCNECKKYQVVKTERFIKELPPFFLMNTQMTASTEGYSIPSRLWLQMDKNKTIIVDDSVNHESLEDCVEYELVGTVDDIKSDPSHLVAHIKTNQDEWHLFNDFLVQPVTEEEVVDCKEWKVPVIVHFRRVRGASENFKFEEKECKLSDLLKNSYINRKKDLKIFAVPLTAAEIPGNGFVCAIDAEFVALSNEESEIRSDGTRSILRPSRLALARVSVLRGDGPQQGVPFIDEYIYMTEPVVDYLTEFSGIKPGDLDRHSSSHPLVSLKTAYRKLRALVDAGCIFVGHGLIKDFRIINITVPPEQVIDTVDIYFIKSRSRRLSLRYLAWMLLKQDIQQNTHDSIEDASTALALYKKYLEFKEQGIFEQVLEDLYEDGKAINFKPPTQKTSAAPTPTRPRSHPRSGPSKKSAAKRNQ